MMNTDVPSEVLKAAKSFVEWFGVHFKYIGRYEESEVYMYQFPETMLTGFPYLFLLNPETRVVTKVTGPDVFKIFDEAERADEKEA